LTAIQFLPSSWSIPAFPVLILAPMPSRTSAFASTSRLLRFGLPCLWLLLSGCSGDRPAGGPAPTPVAAQVPERVAGAEAQAAPTQAAPTQAAPTQAAPTAPTVPDSSAAAAAVAAPQAPAQDPVPAPSLVDVLLAQRNERDKIYLADCGRESESPVLSAIRDDLRARGVNFDEPGWPNHQYYLNSFIPMTRFSGKAWLIYDPTNEPLAKLLRERCLDVHKLAFEQDFPGARLVLVLNEFRSGEPTAVALEPITERGSTTTSVAFTPDGDYMLVAGKEGHLRWFHRRSATKGTLHRFPAEHDGSAGLFAGGESGLIGMAVHPQFATNSKLYLHYNWRDAEGQRQAVIAEWVVDRSAAPKTLSMSGERRLLTVNQVRDNHNAGCLRFGPDGFLYVAIGDGEEGQWTSGRSPAHTLRGKILRIDIDNRDEGREYAIPADNPFVGVEGFPPETWAWGFRNPWRFSFTPDGMMVAGDVGEDVNEEITYVVKGRHHGWPYFEGLHQRNPWRLDEQQQPPILAYSRDHGMSVTGGYVYTGDALPDLRGQYIFADFLSGRIWAISLPSPESTIDIGAARELLRVPLMIAAFAQDAAGELYVGAHTGEVFKLVPGSGKSQPAAGAALQKADPSMARAFFAAEYMAQKPAPATAAQIRLGRRLFQEPQLSRDGQVSCATCHDPARYGQDGKATTDCGDGRKPRNTPSVWNVQRQFAQFRDYRAATVEDAIEAKLLGAMGFADPAALLQRLNANAGLRAEFAAAFPAAEQPVSTANTVHALGGFLRALTTRSRWDDFLDGDDRALSDAELVGLNTFVTVGCMACHQYRGLGGGMPQKLGLTKPWRGADKGRGEGDSTPGQEYFFKVPTLFNVAETAPYYHDGSMATLADAVRNMAEIQLDRKLTDAQVESMVTFLKALTGKPPAALRD